ncbi:hypothetical protein JTB14_027165 [Gonioctena quinquepunctata]|nr:hypothetical protein JTB14_027165 [Gonioctena quinquepunctata]
MEMPEQQSGSTGEDSHIEESRTTKRFFAPRGKFPCGTAERGERLTEDQKEDISEMVNQNDKLSTRRISSFLHISQSTVFRTLKKDLLHLYHPQLVQRLHPGDNIPRLRL